mmetsp:Transcript_21542/g.67308  ORF Transcript_21542/g.67308 Transcript_21542/m.67308 type:complete len:169 (-) Transcript_21542:227-733(-)
MVTRYGMAEDEFGLALSGSVRTNADVPEDVGRRVSRYVERLMRRSYLDCRRTLKSNWGLVQSMRHELLDKETIDEPAVEALWDAHRNRGWGAWWARLWRKADPPGELPLLEGPAGDRLEDTPFGRDALPAASQLRPPGDDTPSSTPGQLHHASRIAARTFASRNRKSQ